MFVTRLHGFTSSHQAVKRFAWHLRETVAVVLSSRKGYSEVDWRQTSESFIHCLENSYRHFGGVLKTTVIGNLRAPVTRADWYDPEINPKVAEFCRHYGAVTMQARPAMPRNKGKVEAGVKYGQNNAVKERVNDT